MPCHWKCPELSETGVPEDRSPYFTGGTPDGQLRCFQRLLQPLTGERPKGRLFTELSFTYLMRRRTIRSRRPKLASPARLASSNNRLNCGASAPRSMRTAE